MNDQQITNEAAAGLGRCGTCKHWQRYTDDFDVKRHGKHAGECNSKKFLYYEGQKPPQDGLRYWDSEGYSAGFDTGEDFGCVHWDAAERQLGEDKMNTETLIFN